MEVFRVLDPGPFTTVQDMGRYGFQQFGVPISGAMDQFAYRVANLLVGNRQGAAALEITAFGPRLEVLSEADVAVTGADIPLLLDGEEVPRWASVRVRPGQILSFGPLRSGCRAYLAVSGGIDVPLVMGSRSTCVGARIGGCEGRPLAKGDVLRRGDGELLKQPRILPEDLVPTYPRQWELRAIPGPQDDHFDEGLDVFFSAEFVITPRANRMGYRLEGPEVRHKEGMPKGIISEASVPGAVQVPPDGQPIVLGLEQTVGGYTKIATVITVDMDRLAQAKPGEKVRFQRVDLKTAHALYREREEKLQKIEAILGG